MASLARNEGSVWRVLQGNNILHVSVSLSGLKGDWEPGSIWEEFAKLWIKKEQINYSPSTAYKTQGPKEGRN